MPLNFRNIIGLFFLSLSSLIITSCQTQSMAASTSTPFQINPEISSISTDLLETIVISNLDASDFGWKLDGQVYYGIQTSDDSGIEEAESKWYVFDEEKNTSEAVKNPNPALNNDELLLLEQGQAFDILNMTISPNGDKVIYTRLPEGYERPEPLPHDYVDPVEIWVVENLGGSQEEITTYPLLNTKENLYDCGSALSAESKWFFNETLVLGSCSFNYGITTVYFMADLLDRNIEFLDFEDEIGQYIPVETIAVAHNSPSLSFYTNGTLWIVPNKDDVREIPLKLSESNFLLDDRPAIAPIWSSDDKWIYYWTFSKPTKYDNNGFVEYQPWWLEKINIFTRQHVVVLSEEDLLSLLGQDMYRRHTPLGFGNPWKLSPDEKSLLLFLSQTTDTVPTLFLISWR